MNIPNNNQPFLYAKIEYEELGKKSSFVVDIEGNNRQGNNEIER